MRKSLLFLAVSALALSASAGRRVSVPKVSGGGNTVVIQRLIPGGNLGSGTLPGEWGSPERSLDGTGAWNDYTFLEGERTLKRKNDPSPRPEDDLRDSVLRPAGPPARLVPGASPDGPAMRNGPFVPGPSAPGLRRAASASAARPSALGGTLRMVGKLFGFQESDSKTKTDEEAPKAIDHLSRPSLFQGQDVSTMKAGEMKAMAGGDYARKMGGGPDRNGVSQPPRSRHAVRPIPSVRLGEARAKVVLVIEVPQRIRPEQVLDEISEKTGFERTGPFEPIQPRHHRVVGRVPAKHLRTLGTHIRVASISLDQGPAIRTSKTPENLRAALELGAPDGSAQDERYFNIALERLNREQGVRIVQTLERTRGPRRGMARLVLLADLPEDAVESIRSFGFVRSLVPVASKVPPLPEVLEAPAQPVPSEVQPKKEESFPPVLSRSIRWTSMSAGFPIASGLARRILKG